MENNYFAVASKFIDNLGSDNFYSRDEDFDYFSEAMDYEDNENSYEVTCGASKVVLVFDSAKDVIKLPLFGEMSNYYYCSLIGKDIDLCLTEEELHERLMEIDPDNTDFECGNIDEGPNGEVYCQHNGDCYECPYQEWEEELQEYTGAVNSNDASDNYCATEEELYQKAKENGVEEFFLETKCIGTYEGIPIYIQPKVESGMYGTGVTPSKDSEAIYKAYKETELGVFDNYFGAMIIEFYGEIKSLKLFNFIKEQNINDLHAGNCGFMGNAPVIFDYSGYRH